MPYHREQAKIFEEIINAVRAVTEAGGQASRIKLLAEIRINHGLSQKKAEDYVSTLVIAGRLVQNGEFLTSAVSL